MATVKVLLLLQTSHISCILLKPFCFNLIIVQKQISFTETQQSICSLKSQTCENSHHLKYFLCSFNSIIKYGWQFENIAVLNFNQNLAKRLDTCEISNVISGNKQINHKYFFTVTFLLARIQFDLRLYLVKSSLTQTINVMLKWAYSWMMWQTCIAHHPQRPKGCLSGTSIKLCTRVHKVSSRQYRDRKYQYYDLS